MVIVTPTPALLITLNVEPVVLKVVAAPVLMPMVNRGVAPKAEPSGFRKLLAVIIPTVTSAVVFTPTPESLVILGCLLPPEGLESFGRLVATIPTNFRQHP